MSECVDCLLDDARESVHRRGEAHVPLVQLVQGLEQLGVDVADEVEVDVWMRLLMWMCGCMNVDMWMYECGYANMDVNVGIKKRGFLCVNKCVVCR